MPRRLNRPLANLFAGLALIGAVAVYLQFVYMLGFPDGFISQLGHVERLLAKVFIAFSVFFGWFFHWLGRWSAQREIGRFLTAAIVFYVAGVLGFGLVDYYCRLHLMGSGGG